MGSAGEEANATGGVLMPKKEARNKSEGDVV
jgi:hypothetical protein